MRNGCLKPAGCRLSIKGHPASSLHCLNKLIDNPLNNRYGLKELKRYGEAGSADPKVVEEERVRHKKILEKHTLRNSFNADECALNGFTIPDWGMVMVLLSGLKKSKQRISILFVCNGDGSEKLPPFFIGKAAQLRCFQKKTAKELALGARSSDPSWNTVSTL